MLTTRDDVAGTAVTVRQGGGDGELPGLSDAHVGQALVPALDDLTHAELEGEGLVAVVAVEKKKTLSNRQQARRVIRS